MKNALLEIGVEHLPARFLMPALSQMQVLATDILNAHNLKFVSLKTYGTFRRLVLEINDLASKAEDIEKEVKGPPAKLLKDDKGNYTPQAVGFAEKNGINPKQIITVETDKGPFLYAKVNIKGAKTEHLLPVIFTEIIKGLTFPKNMVWEESGLRFARPIRSLIGLYGAKIIPFEIAGVKAGRGTYPISSFGRTMIKISAPEAYIKTLKNQPQPILADPQERRAALVKAVNAAASKLGYKADLDEALIEETTAFTEHPVALAGNMDIKFLTLPKELLTTVLKKQLKMFPLLNDKGKIQPHFIAVRDGISANQDEVRVGFKNVMTARLTDAVFFFENDKKTSLDAMREKLKTVNFIDHMGTMLDKTRRVEDLNAAFGGNSEAAKYCYADLTSSVVYEFPELQGYMGGVYAKNAGLSKEICQAISEFYLPLTASSELPQSKEGLILSLAGKLDTLTKNFMASNIPTGSEDPFALRRAAMGAVRIMLELKTDLTLRHIVNDAKPNNQALYDFMWQRFANILEQQGIAADEIDALKGNDRPLHDIITIAKALNKARAGEALTAVGEAAKRVGNILKKSPPSDGKINPALFKDEAETKLYETLKETGAEISAKLDYNKSITEESCIYAFNKLAGFKTPLEQFFERVMVNDSDEALKNNRLALLTGIDNMLTSKIADLSKLQKRG